MKIRNFLKENIYFLIPLIIGLIGLILGSLFDLEISKAIAKPTSTAAKISESFSSIFGYLLGPTSAALIYIYASDKDKVIKILGQIVIFLGILITSLVLGKNFYGEEVKDYVVQMPLILCYVLSFSIVTITSIVIYYTFRKFDKLKCLRAGLIILCCLVLSLATQTVLKHLIGRPRYRYLYSNNCFDDFKNWYQISFFKAESIDELKSCPSGHTATSLSAISLIALTPLFKSEKQKLAKILLYVIPLLNALIVAIFRMLAGAHFLSDVSISFIYVSILDTLIFFVFNKTKFLDFLLKLINQ